MEKVKINAIIESYEKLVLWLYEADYKEWITSVGMFFEIKNNDIVGDIDVIMVENYNIRYISIPNSLHLFDEEYCWSVDNDFAKQLIDYGYHLNN